MYLLDSNMLSEIIKKNPNKNFIKKLGTIPSPAIFTATICIMELRYGAMKRGNPSDFWQMIEQHILSKVRILNFSYTEALKAGELKNTKSKIYLDLNFFLFIVFLTGSSRENLNRSLYS